MDIDILHLKEKVIHIITTFGPKLLGALLVFVLGLYIINILARVLNKVLIRRGVDVSLHSFLGSMVTVGLKVLLLISVAGMIGIETTSFVAVVGALGLAVGLALQGSLSNFAGGVLTLVFKPFKVGDLIEVQGHTGVVQEIQIFNTILLTPENKTVILANGAVSNGTIINYNRHGNLRVDISMSIANTMDIDHARAVIVECLKNNPKVLQDPAPKIGVLKVGDGGITMAIRPYATAEDYWSVFFQVQEDVKKAFDREQISAPLPTRVVVNNP
ncbi:MAG: mechanosensitive ion channel [Chitinophagaceae bacterium]|nr:mechanosensitive ion channel [Chitinophagaceae bacterium]